MLYRHEVVQRLLGIHANPSYLEVGVNRGVTFHCVVANAKSAVDPAFLFDVPVARQGSPNAVYHETTSDEFFDRINDRKFHVIYLDGLHTFDQTLRDLTNAIDCLDSGGAIVIDDTVPSSYAASLPTMEDLFRFREATQIKEDAWMGDVYRLVFFVRDFLLNYSYATVAETHGQTVIWRARRSVDAPRGVAEIAGLDYARAMVAKQQFNILPMDEIEALVRQGATSPCWHPDR